MLVQNNHPTTGLIHWSNVNISYKGLVYKIADGSTDFVYIYWKYSDPYSFYGSDVFPVLGDDDLMVFLNKNGTHVKVPTATVLDGSLIVPETILANAISANAITTEKLMANSVNSDKIVANSIGADKIASNAVVADKIMAGSIKTSHIATEGIDVSKITGAVSDTELSYLETRLISAEGKFSSYITVTKYNEDINGTVNGVIARLKNAETAITQTKSDILLRVTKSELDTRMGDVVHRLDSNESQLGIQSTAISQRVTQTVYNALVGRVTTAESTIVSQAGTIALKASQSDLNTAKNRLDTAESLLTVHTNGIATKVEKNGVISSINQSAEQLKINIAKVTIDGDLVVQNGLVRMKDLIVDKVHIKDGAIIERMISSNVIANVVNAGTANIDFARIGNVQITNAMVSGTLDANKVRIGGGTVYDAGYDPTTKETPTGAQAKATLAETNAKAHTDNTTGNLVKNPQITGSVLGWTSDGGGLTYDTQTFQGATVGTLLSNINKDVQNFSEYFKIDPSKAYLVSVWVKKEVATGMIYLGLNAINLAGASLSVTSVNRVGGSAYVDANPYFWNTATPSTAWVKLTGYLMPSGTDTSKMKDIGENVIASHVLHANTDRVRLRVLNYGNAGVARKLWFTNPIVSEIDPDTVFNGVKAKVTTELWKHPTSTLIDGGKIQTNSITANQITVGNLSALSANLGSITSGHMTGTTMSLAGGKFVVDSGGNVTFGGNMVGGIIDGSSFRSDSGVHDSTQSRYGTFSKGEVMLQRIRNSDTVVRASSVFKPGEFDLSNESGNTRITGGSINANDLTVSYIITNDVRPLIPKTLLTLQNAWQNFTDASGAYAQVSYQKDADGRVYLSGVVKSGAIGTVIATLPLGCRPARTEMFACVTSGNIAMRLDVLANGTIIPQNGSNVFISLSGVSFLGEK